MSPSRECVLTREQREHRSLSIHDGIWPLRRWRRGCSQFRGTRASMRRLLFLLALTLVPGSASALTIQEVVTLSKAGVSEAVLLAMVERDNSIFPLNADQ